ncbi:MAG: preprotein translocase subunit YajC [Bacteroidales bacterium]|nr:preprotein translocase subunit YajC [Bacteroidales bacterium]
MNILNMFLLQAPQQQSSWSGILMIVLIFVIFWLFFIRPQNKRAKEQQKFRENLQKGDKIVTIGGIHGKVDEVRENTVVVSVDHNTKIEFEKSAIIPNASQVGGAA